MKRCLPVGLVLALLLGVVGLVPAFPARADESEQYLFDHVGNWTFTLNPKGHIGPGSYAMTAAEQAQYAAKLERLAAIVHDAPTLDPPRGIDAAVTGSVGVPYDENGECRPPYRTQRVVSELRLVLKYYYMDQGKAAVHPYPANMDVDFNNTLPPIMGCEQGDLKDDRGRTVYRMPAELRKVGGYPLYRNLVMLITLPGRPFWLPVSREQYLRALMTRAAADGEGTYKMLLDLYRKELDALTTGQRRSQAYIGAGIKPSGLCEPGDEDASPVVTINPDYFDPTLPRTAVQLITIRWYTASNAVDFTAPVRPQDGDNPAEVRISELLEALDYRKIAALLDTGGR
ncbi:MAG TPA: hypothetical protein VMF29_09170 [Candidatus Edwardsbacteria bacterium]|nr:hypothetical protein [Candidatus Edwardsbacteria bacterium]